MEARAAFGLAREQSPQNAGIVANLANLEAEDFRFEAAWELFTTARAMDDKPVFRHDEALARMLAGDYEKGWRLFEARADMPNKMRLLPDCPHWNGESLKNKKLLIIAEQGFGDVVQFCRYEQFLPEGDLVWAVPQNLTRLLSMNLRGKIFCEKISPARVRLLCAGFVVAFGDGKDDFGSVARGGPLFESAVGTEPAAGEASKKNRDCMGGVGDA